MTDSTELEIAILRSKKSKSEISAALGISEVSLYRKINNITEFKASEIQVLCEILDLKEPRRTNIFFAKKVI